MHESLINEFLSKQTPDWQNKTYSDGKYFGVLEQDKRNGHGIMYYNDQVVKFGVWQDDNFRFGNEIYPNGDVYDGCYWDAETFNGICHGQDGSRISGHWVNGKLDGYCAHYFAGNNEDSLIRFSGYFKDGMPNGIGMMMTKDGLYYGIYKGGEQVAGDDEIDNSPESVHNRLSDIILTLLGVEPDEIVNEAKLVEDLSADDLDMVNILTAVEGQFGFVANDEDFGKVVTFGDLVEFVMQNLPK